MVKVVGSGSKREDVERNHEVSRSTVLLEGEKMFSLEQGVAQGCSLSPILFLYS